VQDASQLKRSSFVLDEELWRSRTDHIPQQISQHGVENVIEEMQQCVVQ
jgi:hypothetical protein